MIESLSDKEATKAYNKSYIDKRKPPNKVVTDEDGNTTIDPTLQKSINYCFFGQKVETIF